MSADSGETILEDKEDSPKIPEKKKTKFDVVIIGAGPAGLVAAKAIGENGFEVALLERKPNITVLNRACGQTLDSANEYLHHDLFRCNILTKMHTAGMSILPMATEYSLVSMRSKKKKVTMGK